MPAQNGGSVEQRILEMRLDHQKFESGANRTIGILERLDAALASLGKNNSDGFDSVGDSLDKVTNKISIMGTVGDQVIRNLTTKAMELVAQMTHLTTTLTIDQIGAGWSKYAEKTQGIQTIMAATAKDWDDQEAQMEWVNAQIEKLNWFTDETSYNFLDMVNNIGKFTSAGIALPTAVTAMEGIATWAAISGANAQTASHAMYQLSQAMGSGAVRAQDWRSIETANMATKEFKETVLATAADLKTLISLGNGKYRTLATSKAGETHEFTAESFREFLKDDWFTSEVLIQALQQYGDFADALQNATIESDLTASEFLKLMDVYESGDMKEFNRLAGKSALSVADLTELIEKLSGAEYDLGRRAFRAAQEAKTFQEAIDSVKDAASTSWMNLFEKMFGGYLDAKQVWTDMSESLYNIFVEPINKLNEIFKVAFGKEGPALTTGQNLFTSGLLNLLRIIEDISEALSGAFDKFFGETDERGERLYYLIERFHRFTESIQFTEEGLEALADRFVGIFSIFRRIKQAINTVVSQVVKIVKGILSFISDLYKRISSITSISRNIIASFKNIIDAIKSPFIFISEHIRNLIGSGDKLNSIFNKQTWIDRIARLFTILSVRLRMLTRRFKEFMSGEGVQSWIFDRVNNLIIIFNKVKDTFTDVFNKIVSLIDAAKIAYASGGWTGVFDLIRNSVDDFLKEHPVLLEVFMTIRNFAESIKQIFEGILAPIRAVIEYASMGSLSNLLGFTKESDDTVSFFQRILDWLYGISIKFRDLTQRFKEFMSDSETISFIIDKFDKLRTIVSSVIEYVSNFKENGGITGIFESISKWFDDILQQHPLLLSVFNIIKSIFSFLGSIFTDEQGMFSFSISGFLSGVLNFITKIFGDIISYFTKMFAGNNIVDVLLKIIKSSFFIALGESLFFLVYWLKGLIGDIYDMLASFEFDAVYFGQIAKAILNMAISIAILALSIKIISTINPDAAIGSLFTIGTILTMLIFFSRLAKNVLFKGFGSFIAIALSILILAFTLKMLGNERWEVIEQGLFSIGVILLMLVGFTRLAKGVLFKGFGSFIAIALSILILAYTLRMLGNERWEAIEQGIFSVGVILLMLIGFTRLAKGITFKGFTVFIAIALAVLALSYSLRMLGNEQWEVIEQGLFSIGVILLMLVGFTRLAKGITFKGFTVFIAIALAVLALSYSLRMLGNERWEAIEQGMFSVGVILLMLIGFTRLAKGITFKGFGSFIAIGLSLLAFAYSIKMISDIGWEQLEQSLFAVGAVLLMMIGVTRMAQGGSISLKVIISLLAAAVALVAIGFALSLLKNIDWDTIGKAVLVCLVTMVSLSLLITMLGNVPIATIGNGLLVLAAIVAGVGVILAIAVGIGIGIIALAIELAKQLNTFVESLNPFIESVKTIDDNAANGADNLAKLMSSIAKAEFWGLLGSLLNAISDPSLGEKLSTFIDGLRPFLENVPVVSDDDVAHADNISKLLKAAFKTEVWATIGNIFSGNKSSEYAKKLSTFAEALAPFIRSMAEIDETMLANTRNTMDLISAFNKEDVISKFGSQLNSFYKNFNGKNIKGDLSGLKESIELIREFISTITVYDSSVNVASAADSGVNAFIGQVTSRVGDISDTGLSIDTSLIEGMVSGQPLVDGSGADLMNVGVDAIVDQFGVREGDIHTAGYNFGAGLSSGMFDSSSLVTAASEALGNNAIAAFTSSLDMHSPSRVMASLAAFIPAGVAKGITDNVSDVNDSMVILSSGILAALQMAMAMVATVADENFEFNPTITPVVDLSNVSDAAGSAGALFGGVTAAMRGSVRVATDNATSTMAALQYNDGSNNIVNELEFLSDKVDKLGDAITNMKIVLDTGLLVGATSGKMNTALGVAQMRSERGN